MIVYFIYVTIRGNWLFVVGLEFEFGFCCVHMICLLILMCVLYFACVFCCGLLCLPVLLLVGHDTTTTGLSCWV